METGGNSLMPVFALVRSDSEPLNEPLIIAFATAVWYDIFGQCLFHIARNAMIEKAFASR